jgi:SAM-dependent methyltransferase
MKHNLEFIFLILKALFYRTIADRQILPGKEFEAFGMRLGIHLLMRGINNPQLIFNPVSCVRYFEFDFVRSNLDKNLDGKRILDVASPYLCGLYICKKNKIHYQYINLNQSEIDQIQFIGKQIKHNSNCSIELADATDLLYPNGYFDHIFCISVIEHINGMCDSTAMKEMWRVLKPNGKLILTFPIKKSYEAEFRDDNAYGLDVEQKGGKYFFQRYYDQDTINKRLLSIIPGYKILSQEIFGEIEEGFFQRYEKRWLAKGLSETVKDPYYMSRHMKYYGSINDIRGMAVMGLTLLKPE